MEKIESIHFIDGTQSFNPVVLETYIANQLMEKNKISETPHHLKNNDLKENIMNKYNYLIFDLDNTLLNFSQSELHALREVFTKHGVIFNDQTFDVYKEINHDLWTRMEEGRIKKETVLTTRFSKFFATQGVQVDGAIVDDEFRRLLESRNDLMPGALEVLSELKERGYKIFAGTNGVGRTQRQRLENASMTEFFDGLYISEEVGFEKPDVRFFETIFTKETIKNLDEVLMIGDSLTSDIRGANRVGIHSIWLNNNFDGVINDKPTYEVSELKEIIKLFMK